MPRVLMKTSLSRVGLLLCVSGSLFLYACSARTSAPSDRPAPFNDPAADGLASPTSFQPVESTPTPEVITLWISPGMPDVLQQAAHAVEETGGKSVLRVSEPSQAMVRAEAKAEVLLTTWVYVAVAPFPTAQDGLGLTELQAMWTGGDAPLGAPIYAAAETTEVLGEVLGSPDGVEVRAGAELLDQSWETRPSLAVVPFDQLDPRWKVLALDGWSPLERGIDLEAYPLTVEFGLSGDANAVAEFQRALDWPASNRDPDRLSTVVITGVTALTRATAWMMELRGIEAPADHIGDWLSSADITHVSNEVSFSQTCPAPDPSPAVTRFCSLPQHISLLEAIGVDVVELTGNHVMDWGAEAFRYSIDLYEARGWHYYGGGLDLEDSMQPVLLEHNGHRFAFLGCNAAGPPYAWATANTPGSAPCDLQRLYAEIARLRAEGYIPIFTYQWAESYRAWPLAPQIQAFREAIDAGALIVSGSQAHQPQGFEFYGGGFIHYGPGNLFFDQMWSLQTRQEFIDRYVFYDGRHISTELFTAMLEEWFQPRPMTEEERAAFLESIFLASGW